MAIVGWIMLYFWSSFFLSIDIQKPYPNNIRLLNCLNPNVALGLGLQMLGQYETQGNKIQVFQMITLADV